MTRRLMALGLIALVAGTACSDKKEPAGPTAGDLTVKLASSSQTDGAVLLLIQGGVVSGITAAGSYQAQSASTGTNSVRVVVTGAITSGDLLTVHVPDLSAAASYTVKLEAVADRNTFVLNDPAAYTISIQK